MVGVVLSCCVRLAFVVAVLHQLAWARQKKH